MDGKQILPNVAFGKLTYHDEQNEGNGDGIGGGDGDDNVISDGDWSSNNTENGASCGGDQTTGYL